MRPSIEGRPKVLRASGKAAAARRGCPQAPRRLRRRLAVLVVAMGLQAPATVALAEDSGTIIIGDPGQSATQEQSTSASNTQEAGNGGGSITIGDPTQTNDQQATTDQTINQRQSGTFVIFNGALHQTANQNASTVLENSQLSGGLIIGNPTQTNTQHASTTQSINQVMDGTFIVLGGTMPVDPALVGAVKTLNGCADCAGAMPSGTVLAGGDFSQTGGSSQSLDGTYIVFGNFTQSASQNASTTETNRQNLSGSIIIGDTSQSNHQTAVTNQEIDQSLSGTYIVFGTLDQTADQNAETVLVNDQKQG